MTGENDFIALGGLLFAAGMFALGVLSYRLNKKQAAQSSTPNQKQEGGSGNQQIHGQNVTINNPAPLPVTPITSTTQTADSNQGQAVAQNSGTLVMNQGATPNTVHIDDFKNAVKENVAAQTMIAELEKKLEEALKEETNVHTPKSEEALQALKEGNATLAQELFEDLKTDERKQAKEFAQTSVNLGRSYMVGLEFQKAFTAFEEAYHLDPKNWEMVNELEQIYGTLGKYTEAQRLLEDFLPELIKQKGEESPEVAEAYNNLGMSWQGKGNYGKAIEYLEKSLAIELQSIDLNYYKISIHYNNLGITWHGKGNLNKAIEYHDKALAIRLKIFSDKDPLTASSYNNLGGVWKERKKYDKAIGYYEQALIILKKSVRPDHPNIAVSLNNIGSAWHAKGDVDKAIDYLEQAEKIWQKTLGSDHPNTKMVQYHLAAAREEKENQESK